MPLSVRLTQLVFSLVGLSTLVQLARLFNATSAMTPDRPNLAVVLGRGTLVVVAAILLILALQLRWVYARVGAVAMLGLVSVVAFWRGPSAQRWSEAFSLSGSGARGEVLGYGLWIFLVLVLAARLVLGSRERQYFAADKRV